MLENTEEFRRAMKRRAKHVELRAEHTADCRVLPDRMALLDVLPRSAVAAEVGVAFGDFTAAIVRHATPKKLHLVDVWGSERYREGLAKIEQAHAAAIATGAIEINRGMSVDILPTFAVDYFDWVYIDTDHSYETTLKELQIVAPRVKAGGLIAGHDYCTGNVISPWPYGVIEACNQFCVESGWKYRYMTLESSGHNSFALMRL